MRQSPLRPEGKFSLRKIFPPLFVYAALLAAPSLYAALPSPSRDFFVNDFAGALSAEARAEILAKGAALEKATGAQAVALLVNSLEGMSREDFALEILRSWGIGQEDKDNGVLLLVSLEERDVRIEVGYGLEGALSDGKCGRILDDCFIPSMRAGRTDTAVIKTYDAILSEVAAEYGVDPQKIAEDAGYSVSAPERSNTTGRVAPWILTAFFVLFFAAIIFAAMRNAKGSSGSGSRGFRGGPPFSGGSGGRSFGGGGGFSGGGGSGGGGGAGRKW